ncbi:MAG: glycosyltransferase family 4 protein [Rhodoferax sp.]|nr:glycosyltransferase family 4 protein [Rhodoferax sp.]
MPKTIAYIVNSFPELSETFISDEASSLLPLGMQPCILFLRNGKRDITHPSAKLLLDKAKLYKIDALGPASVLRHLALWMVTAPARTIKTFVKALCRHDRWCHFQSLAPAYWCHQQQVEFIHAHFADVNFQYACAIADWSGLPVGVTTHRYDIIDDPLDPEKTKSLLQRANLIATISDFNRKLMVQKYQLNADAISLVRCGVDIESFPYTGRTAWTPGEPVRLLNVGRLVREKGQDILLQAVKRLSDGGIPFKLDIIGGGGLHSNLVDLAKFLDIQDSVVFHGRQTEDFVKMLHRQAHAFVLPSRSEGLPVACIEALAMGTPTIATRINGIPELIEHGISGLLVEPEDAQDLYRAIVYLCEHPDRAVAMCQAGREVVVSNFDRKTCTMKLVAGWNKASAAQTGQ